MRFKKPFKAAPLKDKDGNVIPFREPRRGTMLWKAYGGGKTKEQPVPKTKAPPKPKVKPASSAHSPTPPRISTPKPVPKRTPLHFDEPRGRMTLAKKARKNGGWLGFAILAASLCLIAFGLVLRFGLPGFDLFRGEDYTTALSAPLAGPEDTLYANFGICDGGKRQNCVVDGDTFWFAGEKYRVLDINTPEISNPQCDRELALGRAATQRFRQLINDGPFSLESGPEETDRYGRKLRRVTRGGQSLGDILVAEGLAETWQGHRSGWC